MSEDRFAFTFLLHLLAGPVERFRLEEVHSLVDGGGEGRGQRSWRRDGQNVTGVRVQRQVQVLNLVLLPAEHKPLVVIHLRQGLQ